MAAFVHVTRLTVSLCIPTHGRSSLLVEAMESALTQTRLPDEILVSDDLGSDHSRDLVTEFAKHTAIPVRYLHCTDGPGQAENVNHLFAAASCDLLLLLHDDDMLLPCCIEKLAAILEENPAIIGAYGKQIFISNEGVELPEHTVKMNNSFRRNSSNAGLQKNALLAGVWQQFPNDGYVIRTSVARDVRYRSEYRHGGDFDFGVRMGERGLFFYIDEFTAKYRETHESVGHSAGGRNDDSAYHGMRILSRTLENNPQYEAELIAAMKRLSPMGIRMAANTGRLNEAIRWYFGPYHRQRILSPSGAKTALLLTQTWFREKFARA